MAEGLQALLNGAGMKSLNHSSRILILESDAYMYAIYLTPEMDACTRDAVASGHCASKLCLSACSGTGAPALCNIQLEGAFNFVYMYSRISTLHMIINA